MNLLLTPAVMERACLEGDPAYNGLFFFGVRTTGIFCRPSCSAKKPLPENVEYFTDARAALVSGYRPCKRCRPLEEDSQPPWAAELLQQIEKDPAARITDRELAARGVDPATARRHFLRQYGMTFQAYTRARRLSGAFCRMRETGDIDEAVLESGYESHSGFREAFSNLFGQSPGRSRTGDCIFVTWVQSPLGPLVAGANSEGICLLEFSDRRMLEAQFTTIRERFDLPILPGRNAYLDKLQIELGTYFSRKLKEFTVPLVYPGTEFQRRVWAELLRIPYGETRSYQELAQALGDAQTVRAVGRANGLNRIAILIPCHRVINKGGNLGGYGGGLHRKHYLLALERGKQ